MPVVMKVQKKSECMTAILEIFRISGMLTSNLHIFALTVNQYVINMDYTQLYLAHCLKKKLNIEPGKGFFFKKLIFSKTLECSIRVLIFIENV